LRGKKTHTHSYCVNVPDFPLISLALRFLALRSVSVRILLLGW